MRIVKRILSCLLWIPILLLCLINLIVAETHVILYKIGLRRISEWPWRLSEWLCGVTDKIVNFNDKHLMESEADDE